MMASAWLASTQAVMESVLWSITIDPYPTQGTGTFFSWEYKNKRVIDYETEESTDTEREELEVKCGMRLME